MSAALRVGCFGCLFDTSFYVLYLGRPEIDILLGEYGSLLDMYALLPGFSRYPRVGKVIEVQLALCLTW